jgi:hypothetical protein
MEMRYRCCLLKSAFGARAQASITPKLGPQPDFTRLLAFPTYDDYAAFHPVLWPKDGLVETLRPFSSTFSHAFTRVSIEVNQLIDRSSSHGNYMMYQVMKKIRASYKCLVFLT